MMPVVSRSQVQCDSAHDFLPDHPPQPTKHPVTKFVTMSSNSSLAFHNTFTPSSLQQRLNSKFGSKLDTTNARSIEASKSNRIFNDQHQDKQSSGAFESCFASGLDLSEFPSQKPIRDSALPSSPAMRQPSAASQLLPKIQRRAQENLLQDREEAQLPQQIAARVQSLQNQSSTIHKKNTDPWANIIVAMHETDSTIRTKGSRRSTTPRKIPTPKSSTRQGTVSKKNKRTKYQAANRDQSGSLKTRGMK
jgi:hypothetical protein